MTRPDPAALRRAFGRFITGVTVVTTRSPEGMPVGFTANSFTSVSLDPPLLLVCPGRTLSSYEMFASCRHFAVSILAEGQEEASNTFAGFRGDRFARVPHLVDCHGIPVIAGAVARFSCRTERIVPAGDHGILIGEVVEVADGGGSGLGFAEGRYFSRGLEQAAAASDAGKRVVGAIIESAGTVLLERTASGLRPPQVAVTGREPRREVLAEHLAARGTAAVPGRVYSIFDDDRTGTGYTYFLAEGPSPCSADGLCAVALAELPNQAYASPALADMMARYAREARHRGFGLYLGDQHRGDIYEFQHEKG